MNKNLLIVNDFLLILQYKAIHIITVKIQKVLSLKKQLTDY